MITAQSPARHPDLSRKQPEIGGAGVDPAKGTTSPLWAMTPTSMPSGPRCARWGRARWRSSTHTLAASGWRQRHRRARAHEPARLARRREPSALRRVSEGLSLAGLGGFGRRTAGAPGGEPPPCDRGSRHSQRGRPTPSSRRASGPVGRTLMPGLSPATRLAVQRSTWGRLGVTSLRRPNRRSGVPRVVGGPPGGHLVWRRSGRGGRDLRA